MSSDWHVAASLLYFSGLYRYAFNENSETENKKYLVVQVFHRVHVLPEHRLCHAGQAILSFQAVPDSLCRLGDHQCPDVLECLIDLCYQGVLK